MRLTDAERAENREALAHMSLPQRLDHIFEYYKFPLVLILIAVVAVGSVLYYRLTRKEALLYVACANFSAGDALDSALGEGYLRAVGVDPGKNEVRMYRNLYLSQDASAQNHEYAYASRLKVLAAMANGQLDVMLMNREAYDIMSAGGYLLPLEGRLGDALERRLDDQLIQNAVILEDNEIEHNLDESIPYRAETEDVANGIRVSAFPRFASAELTGDVFLGVIGNSARMDAVIQYIDYLTAEPSGDAA